MSKFGSSRQSIERLFGYDFFISYSRQDATSYALAIKKNLVSAGYSVFLDVDDFPPGSEFRERLRRDVLLSSTFILICSQNAVCSPSVTFEITAFSLTSRPMVVIDIDGTAKTHSIASLNDPAWIEETADNMRNGAPAQCVIREIQKYCTRRRRDQVRIRLLVATVGVFSMLAVLSFYLAWQARLQRDKAIDQEQNARARGLAAEARLLVDSPGFKDARVGLARAIAAVKLRFTMETFAALHAALAKTPSVLPWDSTDSIVAVNWPARLYVSEQSGRLEVHALDTRRTIRTFEHLGLYADLRIFADVRISEDGPC